MKTARVYVRNACSREGVGKSPSCQNVLYWLQIYFNNPRHILCINIHWTTDFPKIIEIFEQKLFVLKFLHAFLPFRLPSNSASFEVRITPRPHVEGLHETSILPVFGRNSRVLMVLNNITLLHYYYIITLHYNLH